MGKFWTLIPKDSRPNEIPGGLHEFMIVVMGAEYMKGKRVCITLGKDPPDFETHDDTKEEPSVSEPTVTLTLKVQMRIEVVEKNTPT